MTGHLPMCVYVFIYYQVLAWQEGSLYMNLTISRPVASTDTSLPYKLVF